MLAMYMSKTTKKEKPGKGRPTKYNAILHNALAEICASKGMIDTEIAAKMQISETTLYNWKRDYPDFVKAISRGKEDSDSQVENALLKTALGFEYDAQKPMVVSDGKAEGSHVEIVDYKEHVAPVVHAQVFWLKNRRPDRWRDKQDIEHSGEIAYTVKPATFGSEEKKESSPDKEVEIKNKDAPTE